MGASEVFINYRGAADSLYAADLLYVGLSQALGSDRVFLDSESIKPGADFVKTLVEQVRGARVVLAVIGPRWLAASGTDGRRRIDDPADWIRRELVEAFDAGVPVIPVLTDNAQMPTEAELPAEIIRLGRSQYVLLRQRYAQADIASLLDKLADLIPADARTHGGQGRRANIHPTPAPVVPQQLPTVPALFAGRIDELATLDRMLRTVPAHHSPRQFGDSSLTSPGPESPLVDSSTGEKVLIFAIGGAGGIGKTWLTLYWAHQRLSLFPDGQLFVDLRGFGPDSMPTNPAVAVRGFLNALGVDPARIPLEPEAQAGLFRSLTANKRMLIVLDNAADTDHAVPLLPGGNLRCPRVSGQGIQ